MDLIYTSPNMLHIDDLLLKIEARYQTKAPGQHILLDDLSGDMIRLADLLFQCREFEKATHLISSLNLWLQEDLKYFRSFKGSEKKLYEWDILCGLQMLGDLINLTHHHQQEETSSLLLKEYSKLSVQMA